MMEKSSRCRKLRSTMVDVPYKLAGAISCLYSCQLVWVTSLIRLRCFWKQLEWKKETKKHYYPQPLSQDIANTNTASAGAGTKAGAGIDAGAGARHYAKEMILRKNKCIMNITQWHYATDITQQILRNRYYARCKKYCISIRKEGKRK